METDVIWRCWSGYDRPDHKSRKNHVVCTMPTGSEIAAAVVWQEASNNSQMVGLWYEDIVIVEIIAPVEFAGHYSVDIETRVKTRGRAMSAEEVAAEYADVD